MKKLRKKKILIFAPGTIGDTVLNLPAFSHLCRSFHKQGNTVHLYNSFPDTSSAVHVQLYQNSGIFDKMRFYPVSSKIWQNPFRRIKNIIPLRKEHYDVLIDIPNNDPDPVWMLNLFGAERIYHDDGTIPKNYPRWKYLFDLFAQWGMPYSESDMAFDWNFSAEEQQNAEQWFNSLNIPEGRIPFAMCTGGKCALQHWPLERYAEVLKEIVPQYHMFPIFFGGPDDVKDAEFLIQSCGCGTWAGNELNLREEILALKKCRFYLGNDTGVMHLAGAAGISGLGIYSARIEPEYWKPLSDCIHTLKSDISCMGCKAVVCPHGTPAPCIAKIEVSCVLKNITQILEGAK